MTEKEQEVLVLLRAEPNATYAKLAELLHVSGKTVAMRIKVLKEHVLIERVGSPTKGYWKILSFK